MHDDLDGIDEEDGLEAGPDGDDDVGLGDGSTMSHE